MTNGSSSSNGFAVHNNYFSITLAWNKMIQHFTLESALCTNLSRKAIKQSSIAQCRFMASPDCESITVTGLIMPNLFRAIRAKTRMAMFPPANEITPFRPSQYLFFYSHGEQCSSLSCSVSGQTNNQGFKLTES
jgi:hypothetical protein